MPDWQERGAVPPDEREFPDLPPIRDRRLSEVDNRGLPGTGGRGRHSAQSSGPGPGTETGVPGAPGMPPWPEQGQQFGAEQYASGPGVEYGQYGQHGHHAGVDERQQAPSPQAWDQQSWDQQAAAQPLPESPVRQAPVQQPPSRQVSSRRGRSHRGQASQASQAPRAQRTATSWDGDDSEVTDDPMEAFSRRWARRGAESPDDTRWRKRLWVIGGSSVGAVIVAVAVLLYFTVFSGGSNSNVGFGSLITTFLPGEIQKVPDACKAVSEGTLRQYLPSGQPEIAAPPLNGGADSQCTWTLDSAPTYRVIEVDVSAFSPSGLASGNGSATFAATDAYANDLQAMESPAHSSGQPKATITDISGLGTAAFGATQVFNVNGATTFKATVTVRYRNVIVAAVVNGLDKAVTKKGNYGPVSMSTLSDAARQVATEAVAQLTH